MSDDSRSGCVRFLFFIPSYDELSLSLMSVAFLVLYFTNPTLRIDAYEHVFAGFRFWALLAAVWFAAGIVFSVYHVFTTRRKSEPVKLLMFFFAVIANYASAIAAGVYIFRELSGWLLVLPILNIVNGVVLILMCGFNVIDESSISDEDATIGEVLMGLLFLCGVLVICQYVLHLHWAITFSICVSFASSLSRLVRRVSHLRFRR